jgi:transcriptional regulatory protein LevR
MELDMRLDLLQNSGTIDREARVVIDGMIRRFKERWGIVLTEENGSRLVTHFSMALMRVKRCEEISVMDRDSIDEFYTCACIDRAREISGDILEYLGQDIPETEREFMLINICLLLDGDC